MADGAPVTPGSGGIIIDTDEFVDPADGVTKHRQKTISNIHHSDGSPINAEKPLRVDVGANLNVTTTFNSAVSTGNSTQTPLAANGVFTGVWEDVRDYAAISVAILTDAASATNGAIVQFSHDAINVIREVGTTIPANVGSHFSLAPQARYVRVKYTNGATAQTYIRSEVTYKFNAPAQVQQPFGAQVTDLNLATIVRAGIAGRLGNGAYAPISSSGTRLQVEGDTRTLSERMFAKAPVTGYSLWLDTADLTYIYIAEALTSAVGTDATFRGIRVQKDASGNPLGKVQIGENFAWDSRAGATWQ